MSVFDRFKLTGKRLFITGGSRGLGREMAVAIADAGADVILVGRDLPSLETTAGDIRTACQAACPTRAIVFGNIKDSASEVARARNNERAFAVLGDLGTIPRTRYLARIRNANPELV